MSSMLLAVFAVCFVSLAGGERGALQSPTHHPMVIAHRGSSGVRPEHTSAAHRLAIQQGADYIECDLGVTRDLILVCIHDAWLSNVTDAIDVFPEKITTRFVDDIGKYVTDVFTVDLTLTELKSLRVKQRFSFRDPGYNGLYQVLTFAEFIQIAQNASRLVGIYPETKYPEWVNSLDFIRNADATIESLLVSELRRFGYLSRDDSCIIQSFSEMSLRRLARLTNVSLALLLHKTDDVSDRRLRALSTFCAGIGPSKDMVIETKDKRIQQITSLVKRAHKYNLKVHPYSFRNEPQYLAWDYGHDPHAEYEHFMRAGVDGFFTDFPQSARRFLNSQIMEMCSRTFC